MRPRFLLSLVLAFVLVVTPAGAALAQPTNDNLADAISVTAVPFTDSVDTSDATLEAGEPADTCAQLHSTVWYAVTLDRNTTVTVDTAGSDYDTVLSVYRGTGFDDFDLIACNDDFVDLQARVSFTAGAGETLFVQAGAFGDAESGSAGQLEISFTRGTKKPSVHTSSFRGNQAFAEWFTEGEDAFSETFVALSDGRTKSGRGRPIAEATLEVFHFSEEFDPDTGAVTVTDMFGFTTLDSGQFSIDRQLRSASVNADMTLEGFRCVFADIEDPIEEENGEEPECESFTEDVTVSVTWTGHGGIVRERSIERVHGDDFRFSFRFHGTSRAATANGSVANDVVLASGQADSATIARASFSFMQWVRNGGDLFF